MQCHMVYGNDTERIGSTVWMNRAQACRWILLIEWQRENESRQQHQSNRSTGRFYSTVCTMNLHSFATERRVKKTRPENDREISLIVNQVCVRPAKCYWNIIYCVNFLGQFIFNIFAIDSHLFFQYLDKSFGAMGIGNDIFVSVFVGVIVLVLVNHHLARTNGIQKYTSKNR